MRSCHTALRRLPYLHLVHPAAARRDRIRAVHRRAAVEPGQWLHVGWPIRFDDGQEPYTASSTAIRCGNWAGCRDPAGLWQRPYVAAANHTEQVLARLIPAEVSAGLGSGIDVDWLDPMLSRYYGLTVRGVRPVPGALLRGAGGARRHDRVLDRFPGRGPHATLAGHRAPDVRPGGGQGRLYRRRGQGRVDDRPGARAGRKSPCYAAARGWPGAAPRPVPAPGRAGARSPAPPPSAGPAPAAGTARSPRAGPGPRPPGSQPARGGWKASRPRTTARRPL